MKYLLDTNIVVEIIRRNPITLGYLREAGIENCSISDVTLFELYYGAYKCNQTEKQLKIIAQIVENFEIVYLINYAQEAARQKLLLEKDGKKIEDCDILIGCSAIANGYVLVSDNQKHLSRLKNVQLINWKY